MMKISQQQGFNLVELMVGLVISLIVLGGAMYVFVGNSESNIFQMRSTRFVQQMRDVMDRMVKDIRRAGYQGYKYYALESTVAVANPFDYDTYSTSSVSYAPSGLSMNSKTSLNVSAKTGEAANSCITYAYNLDDDYPVRVDISSTSSAPYDDDDNELFGFQLKTDSGVGSVRMRTGGGSVLGCDSGSWQKVTDPDVVDIYELTFSQANTVCRNISTGTETSGSVCSGASAGDLLVITRQVEITMKGRSVDDSDLTFSLDQVVDLPNDRTIEVQ
jgi:prepilin-type N-terminal cleavage/methylation domain-containing protein